MAGDKHLVVVRADAANIHPFIHEDEHAVSSNLLTDES